MRRSMLMLCLIGLLGCGEEKKITPKDKEQQIKQAQENSAKEWQNK